MNRKTKRKIRAITAILFTIYLALLIYVCFFSEYLGRDASEGYRYNFTFFKEINRYLNNVEVLGLWSVIENLFGNVLVFVPFGFCFPILIKRHRSFFTTVFATLGLSLIIEFLQLITKRGAFDVDDLLLNTAGGILGYIIFWIFNLIRRRRIG